VGGVTEDAVEREGQVQAVDCGEAHCFSDAGVVFEADGADEG